MLKSLMYKALGIGAVVVQYGCIAHCCLEFVGDFVICSGPSMLNTIHPNDLVVTSHLAVSRHKVERGDIIIARSPSQPRQFICKRITGMAGDIIINPPDGYPHKYVPIGHVWLQGDNTENSTDSRSYGPVPYALMRSKVTYRLWPPDRAGPVNE